MIVSNISNAFFSDLVGEVEFQAKNAGYAVSLMLSYESEDRESDAIARALCRGVDGLMTDRTDILVSVLRDRGLWTAGEQEA